MTQRLSRTKFQTCHCALQITSSDSDTDIDTKRFTQNSLKTRYTQLIFKPSCKVIMADHTNFADSLQQLNRDKDNQTQIDPLNSDFSFDNLSHISIDRTSSFLNKVTNKVTTGVSNLMNNATDNSK